MTTNIEQTVSNNLNMKTLWYFIL